METEYILSSEYYGNEFSTGWISNEDIEFIREIMPKEFKLDIFNESECVTDENLEFGDY
ncbi:hypothetical protein [Anaerophilus nitritogenes]|uniref:hypothetical protein n=1 Tax=Anaerophilus nitritogenes TaxID=2498136 RepID=UPI0013EE3410|nr:hypothetical protein [Anaerophilus nitritogenes]